MPEKKVLATFNARNENDQKLFCRDLAESIAEVSHLNAFLRCKYLKLIFNSFKSTTTSIQIFI